MWMGSNMANPEERKEGGHPRVEEDWERLEMGRKTSAEGSMVPRAANSQRMSVITDMSASDAERGAMENWTATPSRIRDGAQGLAPKYLCYNLWDPVSDFTPNTADWTESAKPLV